MEPIILVFIKLMGAAISGHWDLRDLRSLSGGCQGQALGGSRTKRHILASRSCLAAKMAAPSDS